MPTTSDGRAGFSERIFSAVRTRCPPITRSYSCPNCPRTRFSALRISRATSDLVKSVADSLRNGPSWVPKRVRGRTGASSVAMVFTSDRSRTKVILYLFYTSAGLAVRLRENNAREDDFFQSNSFEPCPCLVAFFSHGLRLGRCIAVLESGL